MIAKTLEKNRNNLLKELKPLYEKIIGNKEKVPEQLTKISKTVLAKYPKNIFFKVIEIKTFIEKPDNELEQCFPDNYFPDENDNFKANIYEFLSQNIKDFDNNIAIIKGIDNIIGKMNQDSLLKKYMSLIDIIVKNFDLENKFLCEVLVTNPFKYKELLYLVDSNLKISPLPKDAQDFYAIKNYSENKKKFTDYTQKNDDNENFKIEVMNKFNALNKEITCLKDKITLQNNEINKLKKESKATKEALFQVQMRDVINAFKRTLLWTFQINKSKGVNAEEVKKSLKEITGFESNKGIEEVLSMLTKLKGSKDSGNDEGHHINNIGFDDSLLPIDIKIKYDKIKNNSNCCIKDCDCVALLLCQKEINDSSEEITKKKYNFFKGLVEVSAKDWEKNKIIVKNLLNSY